MDAFEVLAEQYRPMLLAYLQSAVGDHDLAEDLTQETLLAAYKSMAEFQKGTRFGAWLRGIARNKALASRRASARQRAIISDTHIVDGMEEVYAPLDASHPRAETWSDRLGILNECIQALNIKLRETLTAVYLQKRSLKELAAAEATTYEALAQRVSRSRTQLRECLTRKLLGANQP